MFKLHVVGSNKTEIFEKHPATVGETIVLGEVLKFVDGKLTKATESDVPSFVALSNEKDGYVVVKRIYEDEIYETTLAEDGAALSIGDKLTIYENGLQVTAAAGGVFELCEITDTAVGSVVRGLFRR